MRIAVSGTHCVGKSTLIEEFLKRHTEFAHEEEPYTALQEEYGELFHATPEPEDFLRQLEFNLERLRSYKPNSNVIFERSPFDFLAYLLALADLSRHADHSVIEAATSLVKGAKGLLDLVVYLPAAETSHVVPDSEDLDLRQAMDDQLSSILLDDSLSLVQDSGARVVEATGTIARRLLTLEQLLVD